MVELRDADRTLRINLTEPAHLAHLCAHLAGHGEAAVTEAAASADEFGWLAGHAHEIAMPLTRSGPAAPPLLIGTAPTLSNREHGHLPAASGSGWLYAKLYTHPDRLAEIITIHLPRLVSTLDGAPRWWFVRYRSPTDPDHLRLRIHTRDDTRRAACLAAVGAWGGRLRAEGAIGRLVFDTYQPETGRYGHGEAMKAVEAVFAADSRAVTTGLQLLPAATVHPAGLVAIGMVDIAEAFCGSRAAAMSWLLRLPGQAAPVAARSIADQVTGGRSPARSSTCCPGRPSPPTAMASAAPGRASGDAGLAVP